MEQIPTDESKVIPLSNAELNDLRARALRNEPIDKEQYRRVIESLRTKRSTDIAKASEKKEKREKVKNGTSDEELDNLLGL
jgi:hypothetical protein